MAIVIPAYAWQMAVLEAMEDPDVDQVAAVGSRGPGKSWIAGRIGIIRALQAPQSNNIIFRRTSSDVEKQYVQPISQALANFHGQRIPFNYNQTHKVFRISCPRGGESRLFLAFAEYEKHAEKHMSLEYFTAIFDEITHFEEIIPQLIGGSVRGYSNCKKFYFGNPGGIGHGWVRRRFVKPETRDKKTVVLQPKLTDNFYLTNEDPEYAERITRGLPEWKKRQWLDGDWDSGESSYFAIPAGCVRLVNPPQWARWYAGVDWGYNPSAFGTVWLACWQDMSTGHHRCHVFADLKRHRLLDPDQARAALETEERIPGHIAMRFADPSTGKLITGENDEQTRTTRKTWARTSLKPNGPTFVTVPAKRRGRVPGWMLLREFLAPLPGYGEEEYPHGVLTISPNCAALLAEMTDAAYKTTGSNITGDDIDDGCEDHCLIPGTSVTVRGGDKPIEDVQVGDEVLTRQGWRPVLRSWQTSPMERVYTVKFSDGSSITGTGGHPVFHADKGFVRLDALRCNDSIISLSISTRKTKLARVYVVGVYEAGSSPVYNLTVGGEPEFFANGILVHNCLDCLRYVITMVYNFSFPESQLAAYDRRDKPIRKLITA